MYWSRQYHSIDLKTSFPSFPRKKQRRQIQTTTDVLRHVCVVAGRTERRNE